MAARSRMLAPWLQRGWRRMQHHSSQPIKCCTRTITGEAGQAAARAPSSTPALAERELQGLRCKPWRINCLYNCGRHPLSLPTY
ncbi:hypothetical protein IG631_15290 [Alternaria alternata]|nr:hypothetical protein IG631_15290 [Alternaria alternata]